MNAPHTQTAPWNRPWPTDGLESVPDCPVCGEADRRLLQADLIDHVFRVAPGKWTLWKCAHCGSGYLDPRPTRHTLDLAYADYYTHRPPVTKSDYGSLGLWRRLRRRLVNGYTNWRYSTRAVPAAPIGVVVMTLAIPSRRRLDREYRYLPRMPRGGGRLLDVGCGNGSFLRIARSCGWSAVGVDPDPRAVAGCRAQGFEVLCGGIEQLAGQENRFDVITLNHVIEHLHDPVSILAGCHELLKPGGRLWLETPNIESSGLRRFGENWRGLEAPRHLVLFNYGSLCTALGSAGYANIERCPRPSAVRSLYKASRALVKGMDPYEQAPRSLSSWFGILAGMITEIIKPSRKELLNLSCEK